MAGADGTLGGGRDVNRKDAVGNKLAALGAAFRSRIRCSCDARLGERPSSFGFVGQGTFVACAAAYPVTDATSVPSAGHGRMRGVVARRPARQMGARLTEPTVRPLQGHRQARRHQMEMMGLGLPSRGRKQRAWWLAVRISAAQVGPSYGASAARDRATLHPVHRPALPCASHAAMCRGFLEEHSRFRNQMLPRRDGAWAIGSGEALLYLPVLDLVLHWRLAARHRTAICGDLG